MACVYSKQFSEVSPTPKNQSKVIGQIMKGKGEKPLFQVIAITDDMELAGKTKNTLLKMGFVDSNEEIKQFGKGDSYTIWKEDKVLNINGDFVDYCKQYPDEIEYFEDKSEAEKVAKEFGGKIKQFSDMTVSNKGAEGELKNNRKVNQPDSVSLVGKYYVYKNDVSEFPLASGATGTTKTAYMTDYNDKFKVSNHSFTKALAINKNLADRISRNSGWNVDDISKLPNNITVLTKGE